MPLLARQHYHLAAVCRPSSARHLAALLAALLWGCDAAAPPEAAPPPRPPCARTGAAVLYLPVIGAVQYGSPHGFRLLDAETLAPLDTFATADYPAAAALAPDGRTLYAAWRPRPEASYDLQLYALDAATGAVLRERPLSTNNGLHSFRLSPTGDLLVAYNYYTEPGLTFYDAATFELLWEEPALGPTFNPTFSVDGTQLYVIVGEALAEYDLATRAVVRTLPYIGRRTEISPDGRLLFGVGYRAGVEDRDVLRVLDLAAGAVVDEEPAGRLGDLAVDPTGRYVYTTDPACGALGCSPTNELRRYDVGAGVSEVWADGWDDLGLEGSPYFFLTGYAVVSAGGGDLYLEPYGGLAEWNGEPVELVRVNAATQQTEAAYGSALDGLVGRPLLSAAFPSGTECG